MGDAESQVRFEVTDKSLDFLGFKTLRDLLGSLGKSSYGRHDTQHWATGIETNGASRRYEFGDTFNLDITATLSSAIAREGISLPLKIEYSDLHVHQSRVPEFLRHRGHARLLALHDPVRRRPLYAGEESRDGALPPHPHAISRRLAILVLFHDSAEEMPVSQIARVKVGPYYTNTREGLRVAQRILDRQRKDMKQIVMITDGKPSALTLPDGRIYKNAFGLDPLVVSETLEEVGRCKRVRHHDQHVHAGIGFRTGAVRPEGDIDVPRQGLLHHSRYAGEYLLMDYMQRKMRTVH